VYHCVCRLYGDEKTSTVGSRFWHHLLKVTRRNGTYQVGQRLAIRNFPLCLQAGRNIRGNREGIIPQGWRGQKYLAYEKFVGFYFRILLSHFYGKAVQATL
jgi:hypothetical protein